jgi:hypothetical protein
LVFFRYQSRDKSPTSLAWRRISTAIAFQPLRLSHRLGNTLA